jgi:hypothetical protein
MAAGLLPVIAAVVLPIVGIYSAVVVVAFVTIDRTLLTHHTISFNSDNWQRFFGDVQQTVGGQDIGEIGDIACAVPNRDLHMCYTPVVIE